MPFLSSLCLLTLSVFLTAQLPAAGADTLTSTLADQSQVALTIYNSNLGLVKDIRTITVAEGENELRFMDVASQIMPTTVHIKSLTDTASLHVLEQNYEYDLLSPEKLMEKYVGKEVRLLDKNDYTGKETFISATLLSTNGSPVYQVGNEIHIGLPGRMILPELPGNLIAKPTLVWLLNSTPAGPQTIEASYLTNDITWQADYVAVLNTDDTKADLSGWVSIDNQSGATYTNASLKLVAGDINRVQPKVMRRQFMAMAAREQAPAAPQFEEESFFEYHLYSLDRQTTVKDNQTKQMKLLSASDIPITKRLIFEGNRAYHIQSYGTPLSSQKVSVVLEITNATDNNLGMPLPKGTVRVYTADTQGSLQFVGEDRIDHTPKDETIKIKMGEAFDVVGERTQTQFQRISTTVSEVSWKISLRNHKDEDVIVRVNEPIAGAWEVLSASHQHEKADAHTLRFEVPIPKDSEVKVTYRVRVRRAG